ncbi:MAG: hypothetical protein QNJ51_06270 [Calothrix sp. MO_167.B12]|nr:hypothetical protein [Calothrix sp. MO_167.B12]
MLYLAQVHKNEFLARYQLRLLARQEAEYFWVIIPEDTFILLSNKANASEVKGGNRSISQPEILIVAHSRSDRIPFRLMEKMLVLVELSDTGEIEWVEEATNWIMNLVSHYLTTGITPDFLRQEKEQAEQWRQELTLQSQDLARRSLELEARREKIQSLEEQIKREQNDTSEDSDNS